MIQSAPVNIVPDSGVISEKLDGHHMQAPPTSPTIDEKKESPSATEEEHAEYGNGMQQYAQQHVQQHLHHQHAQQQQHYHNPYAQHQYPPHVISGMVPPQQVYIQQQQQHQHHMSLESQFQSMGLGDQNGTGGNENGGNKDGDNNANGGASDGNDKNESESNNDGSDGSNNAGGRRQIANDEGEENGSEEEPIKLFVGQVRNQTIVTCSQEIHSACRNTICSIRRWTHFSGVKWGESMNLSTLIIRLHGFKLRALSYVEAHHITLQSVADTMNNQFQRHCYLSILTSFNLIIS